MKKIWETGIILFSVCGFWGMIYPDLCFTEDVCGFIADCSAKCATVCDSGCGLGCDAGEGDVSDGAWNCFPYGGSGDIYTGLCDAKPGQIRIRSRIFEIWKSESKGKGNGFSDE